MVFLYIVLIILIFLHFRFLCFMNSFTENLELCRDIEFFFLENDESDLLVEIEELKKQLDISNQKKNKIAISRLKCIKRYITQKNEVLCWQNKLIDEEREDIVDFIDIQIKRLERKKQNGKKSK